MPRATRRISARWRGPRSDARAADRVCPRARRGRECGIRVALTCLALAALACRCRPAPCDARSCATGCCASDGTCREGTEDTACGPGGEVCADCTADNLVCFARACELPDWAPPDAGPRFDAGYASVRLADLCSSLSGATCTWLARCGRLDEAQRDDCRALGSFGCPQQTIDALVARGRSTYDGVKAAACCNEIAASDCVGGATPPGARATVCTEFGAPATPANDPCPPNTQQVCVGGYCRGKTCPGTCAGFSSIGGGCQGDEECGPTAHCSGGASRFCVAYRSPTESCTPPEECSESICDLAQGRCVAPGTLSRRSSCSSNSVCEYGLYCRRPTGFPVGTCEPWERQGGPCTASATECGPGLTCSLEPDGGSQGSCMPQSGPGEPCRRSSYDCRVGLVCSATTEAAVGVCLVYASDGDACDPKARNCKVALFCDPASTRCRKLPRLGETCADTSGPYADCFDGRCAFAGSLHCEPRKPNGDPCVTNAECVSGNCDESLRACQPECTAF